MSSSFRLPGRLRRTLAALAPVILTRDVEERGLVEGVVDGVEAFLGSAPTHLRAGLLAGIGTFEASAALAPGNLGRTFSRLSHERARAHFARWYESSVPPVHQLARALKMFVAFAYYELPAVKEGMGYRPAEYIAEVAASRRERFAEEIAAHEAMVRAPDPLVPGRGRPLPRAEAEDARV